MVKKEKWTHTTWKHLTDIGPWDYMEFAAQRKHRDNKNSVQATCHNRHTCQQNTETIRIVFK